MADEETLELPGGKVVDLADVEDLEDEEYAGLVAYAKQWDSPKQDEWVSKIQEARGEEPTSSEGGHELDGLTAEEVLAWVGDDPARAGEALEHEQSQRKPRKNLSSTLEAMAG